MLLLIGPETLRVATKESGNTKEMAALMARFHRFDRLVMGRVGAARRSWLTMLLVPYTLAGTVGLPWLIVGAAVDQAPKVMIAAALAALASDVVKRFAARGRPEHLPLLVRRLRSASFPSGHAASSAAAACVLVAVAPLWAPLWIAMALLMAVSRIYVGVHYPSDVLAGAGLGILVAIVSPIILAVALSGSFG
jgi:undecaprenyl-diphosphatase